MGFQIDTDTLTMPPTSTRNPAEWVGTPLTDQYPLVAQRRDSVMDWTKPARHAIVETRRSRRTKKYSLPYRVIDGLVRHFLKFGDGAGSHDFGGGDKSRLPVLWHQALLVFAQRYKTEVTAAQKEALKPLLRAHYHHQITPEIRRELFQSLSRGQGFCDEAGREHGGARKKARTVGAAMRD